MCILYCACSVCAKIKSRKNFKLKNFVTQTFPVIRYIIICVTVAYLAIEGDVNMLSLTHMADNMPLLARENS